MSSSLTSSISVSIFVSLSNISSIFISKFCICSKSLSIEPSRYFILLSFSHKNVDISMFSSIILLSFK